MKRLAPILLLAACGGSDEPEAPACDPNEVGTICTIAGAGKSGYSGDDGVATKAQMSLPQDTLKIGDDLMILDWNNHRVRKLAPIGLDLSGIAKGFGVDELARVFEAQGIASYLVSIDGELRAGAPKPDRSPWYVALEGPEFGNRRASGFVELTDAALATSGDYRHVVEHEGVRHAHTIDPRRNAPLANGPASVTVRAPTCMAADAWATAFLVIGPERGSALATSLGLEVLFAERETEPLTQVLASP